MEIRFYHTKKNPLVLPVCIAAEKGYFKQYGIEVAITLAEDFTFDGNRLFKEGKSDVMMGDLTFFFYMLEQGKPCVLTSNLTRTICLVGRKGLKAPCDGLRVGVNRRGLFRLYLENDLREMLPNVEIVWIDNSYERMQALADGSIDALVAIEPFVSELTAKGYEILWHTKESDKNLVMWAFDEGFYTRHREAVEGFHHALEAAGQYFNALTPQEKGTVAQKLLGCEAQFAQSMQTFVFEQQAPIRHKDFELCQEWMYRAGEIQHLYDAKALIKSEIFVGNQGACLDF